MKMVIYASIIEIVATLVYPFVFFSLRTLRSLRLCGSFGFRFPSLEAEFVFGAEPKGRAGDEPSDVERVLRAIARREPPGGDAARAQQRGRDDDAVRDAEEPGAPFRMTECGHDGEEWRYGERVADRQCRFSGESDACESVGNEMHRRLRSLVPCGNVWMREGAIATASEPSTSATAERGEMFPPPRR